MERERHESRKAITDSTLAICAGIPNDFSGISKEPLVVTAYGLIVIRPEGWRFGKKVRNFQVVAHQISLHQSKGDHQTDTSFGISRQPAKCRLSLIRQSRHSGGCFTLNGADGDTIWPVTESNSLPNSMTCPFCQLPPARIMLSNHHAVAVADAFPVSVGHTLIIPRRHVGSFFEVDVAEREALMLMLEEAKNRLTEELRPDGFNIGVNDGAAAGQTIPHLHIHLIPRYKGDRPDPRGGVRWIIPDKADYWSL